MTLQGFVIKNKNGDFYCKIYGGYTFSKAINKITIYKNKTNALKRIELDGLVDMEILDIELKIFEN